MISNAPPLSFDYLNWEGKRAVRYVQPIRIWYGSTKWHPKKQWLLKALDVDKNEERDFAIKDIQKFL